MNIDYTQIFENLKNIFLRHVTNDVNKHQETFKIEIYKLKDDYERLHYDNSGFIYNYFVHWGVITRIINEDLDKVINLISDDDIINIVESNQLYQTFGSRKRTRQTLEQFRRKCNDIDALRNLVINGNFKLHRYVLETALKNIYNRQLKITKVNKFLIKQESTIVPVVPEVVNK